MSKIGTRRLMALGVAVVVLVGSMLLLAGCGEKAAEEKIEREMEKAMGDEGVDVDVDIDADDSGSISISSGDGDTELAFGGAAEVPDGFPEELLPENAEIQSSMNAGDGGEAMQTVTFSSDADVDEMYEWFVEALPKAGYDVEHKMQMDTDEGQAFSIAGSGSATGCNVSGTESEGHFVGSVTIFSE